MCPLSREEMRKIPVLKNKTQGNYVNVYKGIVFDKGLSLKDRGMLLTLLSLPDNWEFTVAGLGKILPDGKAAINSCLRSLQGIGYLTKEQTRGEHGVFSENVIEVHETPISPFADYRLTDKRLADNPIAGNQSQYNNYKYTNQELNNNLSINQENEINQMDEIDLYTSIIKENIGYEYLLRDNPLKKEIIEEITDLIIDTVAIKRKSIRIGGDSYPHELIKSKFLKLDMTHIEYVMDCLEKNTSKVRNIKSYLLTALYNASNTMKNYYQAEVNHDMYGGDV